MSAGEAWFGGLVEATMLEGERLAQRVDNGEVARAQVEGMYRRDHDGEAAIALSILNEGL